MLAKSDTFGVRFWDALFRGVLIRFDAKMATEIQDYISIYLPNQNPIIPWHIYSSLVQLKQSTTTRHDFGPNFHPERY